MSPQFQDLNISKKCKSNLSEIIDLILKGRCCVFIGAGMSKGADYPLWKDIIEKFTFDAKVLGIELSDLEQQLGFAEKVGFFQSKLPKKKYDEILLQLFGPDGKVRYLSNHVKIVSIPFKSFLTTNFDCCLENAARDKNIPVIIQTYPGLDFSKICEGHFIHVHGLIDQNKTVSYPLILSSTEFHQAYQKSNFLPRFLVEVFEKFTMFFIGYSLRDNELNKIIEFANKELVKASREDSFLKIGKLRIPEHYILLHENEANENEDIQRLGLKPIFYRGDSVRHSEVQNILETIFLLTTGTQSREPVIYKDMFEDQ